MARAISAEIGSTLQQKQMFSDMVDERDDLRAKYAALLVDVAAIRTALIATTAKLDACAGTFAGTNYGSLNNPAAMTATALNAVKVTQ